MIPPVPKSKPAASKTVTFGELPGAATQPATGHKGEHPDAPTNRFVARKAGPATLQEPFIVAVHLPDQAGKSRTKQLKAGSGAVASNDGHRRRTCTTPVEAASDSTAATTCATKGWH